MRQREGMQPFVARLLEKLYMILVDTKVPENLMENAAIALGRLGYGASTAIAPHLSNLAPLFLEAIGRVDWIDEKAHALVGFSEILLQNPTAIVGDSLLKLFVELAKAPSPFLKRGDEEGEVDEFEDRLGVFRQVVAQYRQDPSFDNFISTMPKEYQQEFRERYL